MKKIGIIFLMLVGILGCKTSASQKLDTKAEVDLKGNWVITAVTYPGSDVIKVTSFEIADSQCFVGSTWKLVSNNNKGEMALTKSGCPLFASPLTWYVNQEGNFVMKVLGADVKAKRVREGYVLRVANSSENRFQLVDRINVGGTTAEVVYQFERTK